MSLGALKWMVYDTKLSHISGLSINNHHVDVSLFRISPFPISHFSVSHSSFYNYPKKKESSDWIWTQCMFTNRAREMILISWLLLTNKRTNERTYSLTNIPTTISLPRYAWRGITNIPTTISLPRYAWRGIMNALKCVSLATAWQRKHNQWHSNTHTTQLTKQQTPQSVTSNANTNSSDTQQPWTDTNTTNQTNWTRTDVI